VSQRGRLARPGAGDDEERRVLVPGGCPLLLVEPLENRLDGCDRLTDVPWGQDSLLSCGAACRRSSAYSSVGRTAAFSEPVPLSAGASLRSSPRTPSLPLPGR
jgi:hypothetical protein